MSCANPAAALLAMLWMAASPSAGAIVIELDPASSDAVVGEALGIDVVVSGLHEPGGDIVSAFDLDILYDASILDATGVVFGEALGLPGLDAFAGSVLSTGRIDLFNISFLSNSELFAIQDSDSIVLARLLFDAIDIGVSLLWFDALTAPGLTLVGSDPFTSLPLAQVGAAQVNVSPSLSVPEPGPLALLMLGLAAVAMTRGRSSGNVRSLQ